MDYLNTDYKYFNFYLYLCQFDKICVQKYSYSVGLSLYTPCGSSDALKAERGNKMETIHIVIPYIIRGIHNTDDQLNGPSYIKKDMKHTNSKTQQITVI